VLFIYSMLIMMREKNSKSVKREKKA